MDSEVFTIDNEPKLHVTPTHFDFGVFNPNIQSGDHGKLYVTVTNAGGGMLAGRINPQVTWVSVSPMTFRCAPGQSVQHIVQLKPGAPKSWKPQKFSYDFLFLINSNGGSSLLGGTYIINIEKPQPVPLPAWIKLVVPVLLVILMAFIMVWGFWLRPGARPPDQNALFTQGAATVLAKLTQPAPVSGTADSVSMLFTQGAQTVMAKIASRDPAPDQATPSPLPLLGSLDQTPNPVETPSQANLITFTPWPRDQFPNPELFVRDYYSTLNYRNYEKAWSMLSKSFQQSCCNIGGNDPFVVYSNYWNTMKRVDVLSAYIQQWDANPAVLIVSLRYQTKDENTIDTVNTFKLIADAERKTLLIDEVQ